MLLDFRAPLNVTQSQEGYLISQKTELIYSRFLRSYRKG